MSGAPRQGDIVALGDTPPTEFVQGSRRLALVVSNDGYHRYTRLAIVCPISETQDDYPMHVPLDGRTKTSGAVLCEHVRALDVRVRRADVLEQLPPDLLGEVLDRIILSVE